jgi:hypothetical protein
VKKSLAGLIVIRDSLMEIQFNYTVNDQAQRQPPGTCSGCNNRVETFPNHPTAWLGGGSL